MENDILKNNLSFIEKYDRDLVQKIKSVENLTISMELEQNASGQYNLLLDGVPIHDTKDAVIEAKRVFSSVQHNTPNSTHIVFGLGLGYLFSEFCENAKGKIILYEPNIEILRGVLEIVNFEKELSRLDVYIVNDLPMLKKVFFTNYLGGTKVNLTFLNYHKNFQKREIDALVSELRNFNTLGEAHDVVIKAKGKDFMDSAMTHFEKKIFIPELSVLENIFENKPALIVSAGPSLSKNIDFIKHNRNKFVIFCVGPAFKTLIRNGFTPDFLNIIETLPSESQISGVDTSNVNFICEPSTNSVFIERDFKRSFFTYSKENIANHWCANITEANAFKYETKGTVAYNALVSAKLLGCNPIIMVGQDLAYQDGYCYSKDSPYSGLKCVINSQTGKPEIIVEENSKNHVNKENLFSDKYLKKLTNEITTIEGVNGKTLLTSMHYALFAKYFEVFAAENQHLTLINISGGANIKGFMNKLPDDVLTFFTENIDVEGTLKKAQSFVIPDFEKILNKLKAEENVIEKIIEIMSNQNINLRNFQREIERYKQLSPNASKYLRRSLDALVEIVSNLKPKSKIFEIITYSEDAELTYVLKEKDDKYDYATQMIIFEKMKNYFNTKDIVCAYLNKLKTIIIGIEKTYENINSKS